MIAYLMLKLLLLQLYSWQVNCIGLRDWAVTAGKGLLLCTLLSSIAPNLLKDLVLLIGGSMIDDISLMQLLYINITIKNRISLISGRPLDGDGGGGRGAQLCGDGARGGDGIRLN